MNGIRSRIVLTVTAVVCLGIAAPVRAMDPFTVYVAQYFGGKYMEAAFDAVSGKPDIGQVNERLKALENSAALKEEMRIAVRQLRESINERVTLQEFREMAAKTVASIDSIKRRLDEVEERGERQEVEIQDLKTGTNNAQSAEYFERRGAAQLAEKNYHRAIANYNIAIRLNPKNGDSYQSRAWTYWLLQAPGASVVDATEAIRLKPNDAILTNFRGAAYAAIQDNKNALADYSEAIRIDPKLSIAYRNRALMHNILGKRAEAIADCTKAIELDPGDATSYCERGVAHGARNENDLAIADYTAAIGIDRTMTLAFYNRALVHDAQKNRKACLADLDEAIKLLPGWADPYYKRGLVHGDEEGVLKGVNKHMSPQMTLDVSRVERAVSDYEMAVALNPKLANSTYDREYSDLLRDWGWFWWPDASSIPKFTEAIRLNPDNVEAYGGRAKAYYVTDQDDKALADIEVALRLDPNYVEMYEIRSNIYLHKGDLRRSKLDRLKFERLSK